jgi:hypothetical protein
VQDPEQFKTEKSPKVSQNCLYYRACKTCTKGLKIPRVKRYPYRFDSGSRHQKNPVTKPILDDGVSEWPPLWVAFLMFGCRFGAISISMIFIYLVHHVPLHTFDHVRIAVHGHADGLVPETLLDYFGVYAHL